MVEIYESESGFMVLERERVKEILEGGGGGGGGETEINRAYNVYDIHVLDIHFGLISLRTINSKTCFFFFIIAILT